MPGWIGYRFGRRWPVIEPCPACGRPVPRDREVCAACHREFPLPVSRPQPAASTLNGRQAARHRTPDKPRSLLGALVRKELRETVGIVAVGLGFYLLWVFVVINGSNRERIPFLGDEFRSGWVFISWGLATALGLKQSTWERLRGTYLFLLHRPTDRLTIFANKLLIGLVTLELAALVPVVIYCVWAGSAGTHASPFRWWMTAPTWHVWLSLPIVYLGAFLSGLLPARWLGTRLAPLVVASALLLLIAQGLASHYLPAGAFEYSLRGPGWLTVLAVSTAASALLMYCACYVAANRDFG